MKVKVAQLRLTLCDPIDFIVHGILQARILEWVAFPFSRNLPNSGIEPRSPALQADSLPAETQGKPKNTRLGSLSLLQGVFPTQELNQGLLHCRRILYQLSYQESLPYVTGGKAIWNIALARTFSNSFLPTGTSYMSRDQEELICKSLEKEVVALNIHISKIKV